MSTLRGRPRWQMLGLLVSLLVLHVLAGPSPVRANSGLVHNPQWQNGLDQAASVAPAQLDGQLQRIVDLTNAERAKHGLPALTVDPALSRAAQAHSDDMAANNYFSHTGLNGSDAGQRLAAAGYGPLYAYGENIAAGQPSPDEVLAAWMNSDGHRENILSPYYREIGVGHAYSDGSTYRHYWTQEFGSRGPEAPKPTAVPPTPLPQPPTPVPPPPTQAPPPATRPPATATPLRVQPTALPPTRTPAPPTPTAAPPTATPLPPLRLSAAMSFVEQVVCLTNQERVKAGVAPLLLDAALSRAAQAHSEDMATNNYFGHNSYDGSSPWDRFAAAGYAPVYYGGENVAAGQPTPAEVVAAWMNSPGHRENLLNPHYQHIGIGYVDRPSSTYRFYWTQDFASHNATPLSPEPPICPFAYAPAGPHRVYLPALGG